MGEGQNGWLVPGKKKEMTDERRIGRGIRRKAVLEGHTGSMPDIGRKNGEMGPGVLLCWLLSNHVVSSQRPPCLLILLRSLNFGPSELMLLGRPLWLCSPSGFASVFVCVLITFGSTTDPIL